MIDWTPDPIAVSLGPLHVYWYGVMYAVGLAATFWVIEREVRRRGLNVGLLVNGMIIVAIAALIGGRLYHVIDQWNQLYKDNLAAIVLPPYSGLGVYGGIATGFVAGVVYARWKHQSIPAWADVAAPGILVMQGIARWGNFFNQELYGPPTSLPWGIAIQCANRTQEWLCPAAGGSTPENAHFQPLFLYESLSGLVGAVVLLILARRARRLRPGDLFLIFLVWFGTARFLTEPLRTSNWLFFGVPVASIISAVLIVGALVLLAWRHRPGRPAPVATAGPPAPTGPPEPVESAATAVPPAGALDGDDASSSAPA